MPLRPPARWEEYQPLGTVIPGTKFIAFKVPLKQMICDHLPKDDSFSPEELIQSIKKSGKSLGLVVDLTFTRKYYNGETSFSGHEIQYEKIFTEGHKIPSDDVFQRFWDVVDDFTSRNTDEDVLIGVHCTHGVNRTGYLVCRYMIEKLKIDPEKAISLFGEARGHPIERENYISDLKTRPNTGACGASSEDGTDMSGSQTARHHFSEHRNPDQWNQWVQPQSYQGRVHGRGHSLWNEELSGGYEDYWNGGHFHKRSHSSDAYIGPLPGYQGQGYGRGHSFRPEGHPYRGVHPLHKGPGQGPKDPKYSKSYSYRGYSSPLDLYEEPSQSGWGSAAKSGWGSAAESGWGSAAKSGWGSSQSQGTWRDRGSRHNSDPRWDRGGLGHNPCRNYSWRRPDSDDCPNAGSGRGGFRDRMAHVGAAGSRGNRDGDADGSKKWKRKNHDKYKAAGLGEQMAAKCIGGDTS